MADNISWWTLLDLNVHVKQSTPVDAGGRRTSTVFIHIQCPLAKTVGVHWLPLAVPVPAILHAIHSSKDVYRSCACSVCTSSSRYIFSNVNKHEGTTRRQWVILTRCDQDSVGVACTVADPSVEAVAWAWECLWSVDLPAACFSVSFTHLLPEIFPHRLKVP